MSANFRVNGIDTDDLFVRRDRFTEGGLWMWGQNTSGKLGDNTATSTSSPIQTVAGGSNWKQVDSSTHTSAIKTDGTLWLWGINTFGQLGDNSTATRTSPVQTVLAGTNWKQAYVGTNHTAAIKTDGTLWLWGNNFNGQLGTNDRTHRSSPVQTISASTDWKQVYAGGSHTAAIKTDGTLWLWGADFVGQLGDNSITQKSSPVQTVAGGNNWKQVSSGYDTSAAIKTDGTLWMWGFNNQGQLGTNDRTHRSSPVQTVAGGTNWKQVACAAFYTAAIKTDGTLWTWGNNVSGQLGDNTVVHKSSPVQTVSGGTNWKQVDCFNAGVGNTESLTAAIKTDGTLWLWGRGAEGQLGNGTVVFPSTRSSPVQTVAGGTNWKQVACGENFAGAIREDFYR